MAKTQVRLSQLTGSMPSSSTSRAAVSAIANDDLSGVLNHLGSAIARIHGGTEFANQPAGQFSTDLVPDADGTRSLGSTSAEFAALHTNKIESQAALDIDSGAAMTIDSAAGMSLDAAADSNFTLSDGDLSLVADGSDNKVVIKGDHESDVAVHIDGNAAAASIVDIDAGVLDIDASGSVAIDSAGGISIDAAGASNLSTSSGELIISGTGGVSIGGGDNEVDITTNGAIDINGAAVTVDATSGLSLDAAGASNLTTSSGALTLDGAAGVSIAGNSSEVDITTSGALDLNSGAMTLDASTVSLDGTDDMNLTMTANASSAKTMTIAASNSGSGAGVIDMDADGAITVDAGAGLSLDAGAASNLTTSAGALTVSGAGGLNLAGGGSEIDVTSAGAALDVNMGSVDIDATAGVAIDAAGDSNFTLSDGDLSLIADGADNKVVIKGDHASGVAVHIDADQSSSSVLDVDAGTLDIDASGQASIQAAGNSEYKVTSGFLSLSGSSGINITTGDGGNSKVYLSGDHGADSVHVASAATFDDAVVMGSNLTVAGNLDVNGTVTTIDTTNMAVADSLIELNRGASSNANDLGFVFERGSTGDNAALIWDESDDVFAVGTTTADGTSTGNMSHTLATFRASKLEVDGSGNHLDLDGSSNLTATAAGQFVVDAAGDITLDADGGNVVFKDAGVSILNIGNVSSDAVLKPLAADKDIVFAEDGGNEIARFDSSAEALLMASSKKLMLGAAEESLHGDGTDIHFSVGSGGDINIPASIGLTFGDDGEKIEGDGTDLTVASSNILNVDAAAALKLDSDSGDISFEDGGVAQLALDMDGTSGQIDLQLKVDSDDLVFKQYDGNEVVRIADDRKLYFFDKGGEHISGDGNDLVFGSGRDFVFNSSSGQLRPYQDGSSGYSGMDLGQEAAGSQVQRSLMGSEISTTSDGSTQGTIGSSTSQIFVTATFPSSITDAMVSGAIVVLGNWEGVIGSGGLGSANTDNFRPLAIASATGTQDLSSGVSQLYVRTSNYAAKTWFRRAYVSRAKLGAGEYSTAAAIDLSGSISPALDSNDRSYVDLGSVTNHFRTLYAGSEGSAAVVASGSLSPKVNNAFDIGGLGAFSTSPSFAVGGSQAITSTGITRQGESSEDTYPANLTVSSLSAAAAAVMTAGAKILLGGGGTSVKLTIAAAASSGDTTVSISAVEYVMGSGTANTSDMYETPQIAPFTKWKDLYVDGVAYLDGINFNGTAISSTAAELNLLDGSTSVGSSITIADTDGMIIHDGGVMKTIPMSDVKTYVGGGRSKVQLAHSGTVSAGNTFLYSGVNHDQGKDPDLTDVYLNGQLMMSGTSAANGDYKIHDLAVDGVQFFFGLEIDDVVTIVKI